jgi:hypothetical protein
MRNLKGQASACPFYENQSQNTVSSLSGLFSSFLRRRESSIFELFWMFAFADMTAFSGKNNSEIVYAQQITSVQNI